MWSRGVFLLRETQTLTPGIGLLLDCTLYIICSYGCHLGLRQYLQRHLLCTWLEELDFLHSTRNTQPACHTWRSGVGVGVLLLWGRSRSLESEISNPGVGVGVPQKNKDSASLVLTIINKQLKAKAIFSCRMFAWIHQTRCLWMSRPSPNVLCWRLPRTNLRQLWTRLPIFYRTML